MSRVDLDRAREFVWRNARLLDRHRMEVLLTGSEEARILALTALRAYQNPDGGFGNALEPDLRTPLSQPQPAEYALRTLDEIGRFDDDVVGRSATGWRPSPRRRVGSRSCFLPRSGTRTRHGGRPRTILRQTSTPPLASSDSSTSTASVTGGSLPPRTSAGEPLNRGRSRMSLTRSSPPSSSSNMSRIGAEPRPRWSISGRGCWRKDTWRWIRVPRATCTRRSIFARTPNAFAAPLFNAAAMDASLDVLSEAQRSDGGWSITWEAPTPAAELEWRGAVTVNLVRTLQSWDRL